MPPDMANTPAEVEINGKPYAVRGLSIRAASRFVEYVRAKFLKAARESLGDAAATPAGRVTIQAAMETAAQIVFGHPATTLMCKDPEGIMFLVWLATTTDKAYKPEDFEKFADAVGDDVAGLTQAGNEALDRTTFLRVRKPGPGNGTQGTEGGNDPAGKPDSGQSRSGPGVRLPG